MGYKFKEVIAKKEIDIEQLKDNTKRNIGRYNSLDIKEPKTDEEVLNLEDLNKAICTDLFSYLSNIQESEAKLKREAEEKRLKEEKEAEEKRLKEEKEAEEKRLKEEKEAEEKRLKEEKEAEEKRLKEENEKQPEESYWQRKTRKMRGQ